MALKRLLCILLSIAVGFTGCTPRNKDFNPSWSTIFVEAPRQGKPFLSDRLLSKVDLELDRLENALDFTEIEARAESDSQLLSLYGGYLLHKEQVKSVERDNAVAFTDKLEVISDLKSIEGYILGNHEGFISPALEAAASFDEEVTGFEKRFLSLSQQEITSVETAIFLMGAEHVLSSSKTWGQAARSEIEQALPNTYFFLNQYPLFLDLLVARYSDLFQTALEVRKDSNTTLARKDVLQLIERLWAIIDQLQQRDKPPRGTVNYILFDNLETLSRVSRERANLTYASLRLALHSLIAGRLLEKMDAELGQVPIEIFSFTNAEKARVMDWFRELSINSYQSALRGIDDNFRVVDTARWPLSRLETAHALMTNPGTTDEFSIILSLIEAIVSSELVVCSVTLGSLVQTVDIHLSFEKTNLEKGETE